MSNEQAAPPPAGPPLTAFILAALVTLTGMEVMRVLFSLSLYVLRDRLDWEPVQAALLILALFLVAFLAALLRRLFGDRVLLLVTAGGLGLARLLMQFWSGDPLGLLVLAAVGVLCFWSFWPFFLATLDLGRDPLTGFRLATALLSGLLLDVFFSGLYGTYDRVWAGGLPALLLTLFLVGLMWFFLYPHLRGRTAVSRPDRPWSRAWLWIAIGPFLALQFLLLDNLARLNTLTEWGLPAVLAWMLLAHLLGLSLVSALPGRHMAQGIVVAGALLIALELYFYPWSTGWAAALLMLLAQVFFAGALGLACGGLGTATGQKGLARLTTIHAVTGLLLVVLLFGYYAGYDMDLPFANNLLLPLAALLVAIPGLVGAVLLRSETAVVPAAAVSWRVAAVGLALLVLPVAQFFLRPEPQPVAAANPVRVINYNLHNGFGTSGQMDLEALAQMIEAANADVVALQEVSRGWVVNGSVDMLDWLAHRLDMPYVFGPAADPLWGNAVLSRYPLLESENLSLPPDDLLMTRGALRTRVDTGDGEFIDFWDMHLHHLHDDSGSAIRAQQVETILAAWAGAGHTVIMGDTNAEMPTPEMQLFLEAGLLEAVATAGIDPPYTNGAADPWRQIDYIWYTPDLAVTEVGIPRSQASDHFPIVATFSLAE